MPKPVLKQRAFSDLNGLTQKMHMVIKYLFAGLNNTEIGKRLGLTPPTISGWRKHPLVIAQLDAMHRQSYKTMIEMQAEVTRIAPRAIEVAKEILNTPVDKDFNPAGVRANMAVKIMQMTDLDQSNKQNEQREQRIGDKVVDELMSRSEVAKAEGLKVEVEVVDGEFEEESDG